MTPGSETRDSDSSATPMTSKRNPCQATIVALVLEVTRPQPTNVPAIMLPRVTSNPSSPAATARGT